MGSWDLIGSIQIQALRDVLEDSDPDYRLRRVLRWYSKTFHTPLHEVSDLPLEDVLQAYFEEKYEGATEEEREAERQEILETPEQLRLRLRRLDEEEAEVAELVKIEEMEKQEKVKAEKKGPMVPAAPAPARMMAKETDLPPAPPIASLPPDIDMKFVDSGSFEDEIEGLGALAQPEKKR